MNGKPEPGFHQLAKKRSVHMKEVYTIKMHNSDNITNLPNSAKFEKPTKRISRAKIDTTNYFPV